MTLSNLVSGSLWSRETKKNGQSISVVLFVTNEGLQEKVLEKFPQQVVFLTENNQILSMTVEEFTRARTFAGMSEKMASLLESIIVPDDEEEETGEIDSVEVDGKLFVTDDNGTEEESEEEEEQEQPTSSRTDLYANFGPHPKAQALADNLAVYSEAPMLPGGDTLHTLKFNIGDDLTLSDIRDAFRIDDPNSIQKFELTTSTQTFTVDIAGFVNVMLESYPYVDYGCLFVTTEGNFRDSSKVEDAASENSSIAVAAASVEIVVNQDAVTTPHLTVTAD